MNNMPMNTRMKGEFHKILVSMREAALQNTPQFKVSPTGLLNALMNEPSDIKISDYSKVPGAKRNISVRYMQRGTKDMATTVEGCVPGKILAYKEVPIATPHYHQLALYLSLDEVQGLFAESQKLVQVNGSMVYQSLIDRVNVTMNGLLGAIDETLLTEIAGKVGINATTGNATPVPINFTSVNNVPLGDGITKLIAHMQANEFDKQVGGYAVGGFGILNDFFNATDWQRSVNQNGYDARIPASKIRWYDDAYADGVLGKNHFLLIAPRTAAFVSWNRNEGAGGVQMKGSNFFTMTVPVELMNGKLSSLNLDVQIEEIDCKKVIDGEEFDRGLMIRFGLHYGLFTVPTDAYSTTDRLSGVNHILRFIGATA